jgi:hypothetical protein
VGGAERSRRVLRVMRAMRVLRVMRVIAAVNRRGGGGSGEWRWQVSRGPWEADASYLDAHRLGRVESVTLVTLSLCSHRTVAAGRNFCTESRLFHCASTCRHKPIGRGRRRSRCFWLQSRCVASAGVRCGREIQGVILCCFFSFFAALSMLILAPRAL